MEQLRKWREKQVPKKTLAAAGAAVGCSAVQWLRLETGMRPITPEMALRIEAATKIPRETLRPDIFKTAPTPKRRAKAEARAS